MPSAHYDTLILGAGMSGLAAGIRLAHFGQRVAVLERHSLWGGLNSFYKLRGRRHDVGLHALTNYAPPGARALPLARVLRQLRIERAALRLCEQHESRIEVGGARLCFSNDFELLRSEVEAAFPSQRERFERLVRELRALDVYGPPEHGPSARAVLAGRLSDPLLVEALLLPTCYYGSAREGDIDWYQFAILFHSIFLEGLARPEGGIRTLLTALVERLREAGAELLLRCGVERILVEDGRARGLRLADGRELTAERILSSAGWVETMELCGPELAARHVPEEDRGRISFVETISITARPPAELGHSAAVVFFCEGERFDYGVPAELCDLSSGVIASPNNYAAREPQAEGVLRVTLLARPDGWLGLGEQEYEREKRAWSERALEVAARHSFDPRPLELDRDVFTPRTIRRFTSHARGCVYGSPAKRLDGRTPVENLFLCGTDQGLLGVVGALMSGIAMANLHALQGASRASERT